MTSSNPAEQAVAEAQAKLTTPPESPESIAKIVAVLRAHVLETLGEADGGAVLEYVDRRRPPEDSEIHTLRQVVQKLRAGAADEVIRHAALPVEVLERQRAVARELFPILAPLKGRGWRDPKTLRDVRAACRRYFARSTRFAMLSTIHDLVHRHVAFDPESARLTVRTSEIVEELWRTGAY
jgi:hypothetical protein